MDGVLHAWPPAFSTRLAPLRDGNLQELERALAFPEMSGGSFVLRRVGHAVAEMLPGRARATVTSVAKRVRRWRAGGSVDGEPAVPLARVVPGRRLWSGRRAAVVLTHDLDGPDCVAALPLVLALEEERRLRSAVFVLAAADYPVGREWLEELAARAAGVGLHGLVHDYAIGGRSSGAIRTHLGRALERLDPVRPRLYRAPAFGVSERLARELAPAGFRCDSSRTVYHPAYPSTRALLPFRPLAPESDLCELPVALEDSWLFRDWRLDERAALAYCDRVLERALESGGIVVIDTHPSILAKVPSFYPALLDRLIGREEVWITSVDALLDCFDALCAA